MIAYDILTEKDVIIPKGASISVHETFVTDNVKYIIVYMEYPKRKIEIMPYNEYIKRNTIVKYEDGEYRTLKEIEEINSK